MSRISASREERRKALMARQKKSAEISGGGIPFFKSNLPKGLSIWSPDKGRHEISIIPYFAGRNDPQVKKGSFTYVLEVYVHNNVGGTEMSKICLNRTFRKPCPICKHRKELINEGADEDVIKEITVSRFPRSIYNVQVHDTTREEDKGVQIFHTSHFLMEKHLIPLAQSSRHEIAAGDPPVKFIADPDEGYIVSFERSGTGMNTSYTAHKLIKRRDSIPDELLEQAYVLDELIHIPSYKEVYEAYWGESMDTDEDSDPRSYEVRDEGEDEIDEPYAEDSAEETDDSDESEDDKEYECPANGEFGVDTQGLEECDTCEVWDACLAENERLEALKEESDDSDEDENEETDQEDEEEEEKSRPRSRAGRPSSTRGRPSTKKTTTKKASTAKRGPGRPPLKKSAKKATRGRPTSRSRR